MDAAKIRLSPTELELACNAEFILTKNTIIKKTVGLFEGLQKLLLVETHKTGMHPGLSVAPKISRGENYLGLPYIILDYPRISQQNNLCFIRSMFWWGNFFSSTLQVAGLYKEQCSERIISSYDLLASQNYFVGINEDPWNHTFEKNNYRQINLLTQKEFEIILQKQGHIKIASKISLNEWDVAAKKMYRNWNFLLELITS